VQQTESCTRSGWQAFFPMIVHILLCSVLCFESLRKNRLSKSTGLDWEYYWLLWTVNALWMNVQAVILVVTSPPSTSFHWSTYLLAYIGGTLPGASEWFDTLVDTMFAFMCFASPHSDVQLLGVIALAWLAVLHTVLVCAWSGTAVEIHKSYFTVMDAEPSDTDLAELAFWVKMRVKIYAQCSGTKWKVLLLEELPQAAFKAYYGFRVTPDFGFVATTIAPPMVKILVGLLCRDGLAKRIVPFWRRGIYAALKFENRDQLSDLDRELCADGRGALLSAVLLRDPLASAGCRVACLRCFRAFFPCLAQAGEHGPSWRSADTDLSQRLYPDGPKGSTLREVAGVMRELTQRETQMLRLPQARFHQAHLCFLFRLCHEANLRILVVGDLTDLTDLAAKALSESVMPSLEELRIENCSVSDRGFQHLSQGIRLARALHCLQFGVRRLSSERARALRDSLQDSSSLLCSLSFSFDCQDEHADEVVHALAETPTGKGFLEHFGLMRRLPFKGPLSTSAQFSKLLQPPFNLTSIALNGSLVCLDQAKHIGEALANNKTLTLLDLSDNPLGSAGLQDLARKLGKANATSLRRLCLRNVRCTESELVFLRTEKLFPDLRYLDLSSNNLGDWLEMLFEGRRGTIGKQLVWWPSPKSFTTGKLVIRRDLGCSLDEKLPALVLAARHGDAVQVRHLLAGRADPRSGAGAGAGDGSGSGGLEDAIQGRHLDVVKLLVEAGAWQGQRREALLRWVSAGAAGEAEPHGKQGVNEQDIEGRTPLFVAALQGSTEEVSALLAARADVNIASFGFCDQPEEVPLTVACRRQDSTGTEIVELLLEAQSSLDRLTDNGCTPLHAAAASSALATVQVLLDACSDPEASDRKGRTALYYAETEGITKLLLDRKAKISIGCLFEAMEMSIFYKQRPWKLQQLLAAKGDPNAERNGWPLLFNIAATAEVQHVSSHPVKEHQLDMMQALIDHNANINAWADPSAHEGYGGFCICEAAKIGQVDMLKLLIAAGAKVDITQQGSPTALFLACQEGKAEAAQALLSASADLSLRSTALGKSPLDLLLRTENMLFLVEQHCKDAVLRRYAALPQARRTVHNERLRQAAWKNDLAEAKRMLEVGVNVNEADKDGFTPLFIAAQNGYSEILSLLVEKAQANVNQTNKSGTTPLFIAAERGHGQVARFLVEKGGATVNQAEDDGRTPLWAAAFDGYLEIVQVLVEAGAKANQTKNDGASPLYVAAQNGHAEVARILVEKGGANVDHAEENGQTALWMAACSGHLEVVKFLVEKAGANVNQGEKDGATPLFAAAQNGHVEIAKVLIEKGGANVDQAREGGRNPLYVAVFHGLLEVVQFLVEKAGANVNHATKEFFTPLYIAAQNGHLEIVILLVEAGAEVNQAEEGGRTPLWVATFNGHLEIVKYLVEKAGADVNKAKEGGATPLFIAAQKNRLDIARFLIDKAQVDQPCDDGGTPLHMAAYKGHLEMVKLLFEMGKANLDLVENDGRSAVYSAAELGYWDVLEFLLKAGAQVSQAMTTGETALSVARTKRRHNIAQLLRAHGAV